MDHHSEKLPVHRPSLAAVLPDEKQKVLTDGADRPVRPGKVGGEFTGMRFTIRTLLIWTFAAAIVSALFAAGGPLVRVTIGMILLINGVGALMAWIVTNVFGLPRNGQFACSREPENWVAPDAVDRSPR